MTSVTYDVCKFNPNPSAEYVCVICHCVIHEPRMCCCHHIFCKVCIETWLSRSSTCPACRRYVVLKDLQNAPPLVQNVLNSLTMDCDYKAKGCSDPVIKENFPSHIQSCEYRSVHCPHNGCQVETTMRDLPKHKQCCVFRIEQCGLQCGLPFPVHKMLDHDCVTALKDRIIELNGILYRHQAILKWLRQKLNLSHMPHNSQGAQLEAYKMMVADINRYWPAEQPIPVLLCGEFLAAPDKLFSGSSCDSAKEVSQAATQSGNSILETLISEEITLGQMLTSAEQDLPRDIVHRAGTPHPDHGFLDDRGDNLEAVEDSNSVDLNLGVVQWQIMNSEPIPTLSSLDPNRPAQANQTQTLSQRSLYDIESETHPDQFQSNYDENRSYQSAGSSIDDFSSYSDGEPDTPLPDDVDNRNSPLDNYSMYWSYRHSGTAERTGNRPQHGQSRRHGTSRSRSYSRSRSDSRSRNRNYSRSRSRSDSGSRSRSDSRSRSRSSSRSRSRSDRGFRSRSYSLPRSYSPPRRYSHSSGNSPSGGYNPSRSRSRSSSIQSISSERFINHRASQSRSRSRSLDRDRRLDLSTNHSRSWNHRQIRESRNYSEHSDTNDKFSDQAESEPGNRESERELHSHLTSENSLAIEGHSLRYSHVQLEPEQGMNHLDHVYQATNGPEDLVTQPSNADFLQNSDGCRSDHGRSVDLSSSGYWSPSFNQDLCHTPANRVNTQNREEVWHSPGNHSVHEGGDSYLAYEDVGPIASSALDGCDDPISLTVRSNPDLTSSIVISSPGYLSKHNGDFHSRVLGSRHTETDNSPGRKGKHTSHSYAGCSNIALSETDEENEERDRVQHAYDGGSRVRAKSLMHDAWESSSIASSLDHDLGDDSSTPTGSPQPRTNIEQVGIAASPLDASVKQKVSGNKNSTAKKRKRVHDTRSQQGNDQDSENNLSDSRNEHPPSNAHGSHSEKKPGPSTSHHSKGIKRRSRGSSKGKALLKGKHKSGKSSSNSRKNDVCSKPQVRTRGESTFSPRDGSEPNGGLHEQTGVERDNENSTNLPSTSSGTLGPSLKTDKKTRKKAKKEKTRSQKSNHSDQEDSDGQRHKRNSKKRKADKSKHHKSLKRARLNNTLTDGSSHREMRTRASCHRRQASLQSWNRAKSVTATSTSQSSTAADTAGWRAENTNRMQGRPHPEPHKTKDRLPHAHSMNTEANVRTGTSTGRGRQPDRPAQDDRFQSNEGRVTAVDDVQDSHILRAERGERREPPMTRGRRIMRVENPASLGNSRTQRMEDNLRLVTISDIPVPPSTFELLNQFNNSDESDSTWSPSSSDELE